MIFQVRRVWGKEGLFSLFIAPTDENWLWGLRSLGAVYSNKIIVGGAPRSHEGNGAHLISPGGARGDCAVGLGLHNRGASVLICAGSNILDRLTWAKSLAWLLARSGCVWVPDGPTQDAASSVRGLQAVILRSSTA